MNTTDTPITPPERKVHTVSQGTVTVREIPWRPALAFATRLAATLEKHADPEGNVSLTQETIGRMVTESADLVDDLVTKASDLTTDEVGALRPVEVLDLLEAAIAINIHAELLGKARQVGQAAAAAITAAKAGSASST